MLCFTRADFNNLLNFTDLRASELTLRINNAVVAAREITSRFVSNTDVILDRVDPQKLALKLQGAESFTVEVERTYPFHEVLIRPCLELSERHMFAYSPVLWIGKSCLLPISRSIAGPPAYVVVFEGSVDPIDRLRLVELRDLSDISINSLSVGAFFVPNSEVQSEAKRRAQRSQNISGGLTTREGVGSETSGNVKSVYLRALKSLWPADAAGRMPTYIYLREGRPDIRAFQNPTSLEGKAVSGRLGALYEEVELGEGVVASCAPNESIPRSREVDALAIKGALTYRPNEWSLSAGWPLFNSSKDPDVIVRSNGVVRWLRLAHGAFESIERLEDGRNLALGARTAWETYGHLAVKGKVLFAGLGLGVVQRSVALGTGSVTCESNPGVIDAFRYIFPEHTGRLRIVEKDFYEFVREWPDEDPFEMAFLDFYDPDDRYLTSEVLSQTLAIAQVVVINRHLRSAEDLEACDEAIKELPFRIERTVAEGKQLILAVRTSGKTDS